MRWPIAFALVDAGGHKVGAQHTCADLLADQFQILVKGFGQSHHRVFGDVVNTHVRGRQQSGHAGGVDDMALVCGVLLGRLQHHGGEQAHTVDDTPDIHTQQPFPILDRVFPDQAASAHPCVVEHKVGCAKALKHSRCKFLHLVSVGHIHPLGHDLCTHGFDFIVCRFEGVFLHIDQHHIHAQRGPNASAFQAKA